MSRHVVPLDRLSSNAKFNLKEITKMPCMQRRKVLTQSEEPSYPIGEKKPKRFRAYLPMHLQVACGHARQSELGGQ